MGRKAKRDPTIEYQAFNVKLRAEYGPRIKVLVGHEMARTGKYISQQDLLERLLQEKIQEEEEKLDGK